MTFADPEVIGMSAIAGLLEPVTRLDGHGLHAVSYTPLRAHETVLDLVCRLLLEKKKKILCRRGTQTRSSTVTYSTVANTHSITSRTHSAT